MLIENIIYQNKQRNLLVNTVYNTGLLIVIFFTVHKVKLLFATWRVNRYHTLQHLYVLFVYSYTAFQFYSNIISIAQAEVPFL